MSFGKPEITKYKVKCEECGVWYKKITSAHLKKHFLSIFEYKEKWGFYINQPLEAKYIKKLRQHYEQLYKSRKNIINKGIFFKKGYAVKRKISEQRRLQLKSIAVNVQHTKKFKKLISKASKKLWQNKIYRDKVTKNVRKAYKNPELRKKMREQSINYWRGGDKI